MNVLVDVSKGIACKSIRKFLRKVANRQTNGQKDKLEYGQ